MKTIEVDVAIIGAGTAGLNTWRAATEQGAKALMIDPGPLGTTCARVGCMPSKLLIAAGERAHAVQTAGTFGLRVADVSVDGPAVMERVRRFRDLFVSKTLQGIESIEARGGLLRERATITGPHTLQAGDTEVRFDRLVLATGSRPWVPPPYRELGDALLSNEEIFELPDLPESLLVIGAGAMGLELGQAFHRLGTRVTILDLGGRIAGLAHPDVAAAARAVFGEELDLHLDHRLHAVERDGDSVRVAFTDDAGRERVERYRYVLGATGRRPTLAGLGLEAAGLDPLPPLDPRTGRIGTGHVFVAGDVFGQRMLLHEAAHEGRIAGANAGRFPDVREEDRKTALAVVFSDPGIAAVGLSAAEIDPERHVQGGLDFRFQSRAKVIGKDRGAMRVWAEKRGGRLLGAEVVGPEAEHLGHLLAWAIQAGLTAQSALEMPFYHPVVEEGLQAVLREVAAQVQS